jgi:hypothetical protein
MKRALKGVCQYCLYGFFLLVVTERQLGAVVFQPLNFYREEIEVQVEEHTCFVTGTYYFKNNTSESVEQSLYYPFVVNDSLPFPDKVSVRQANSDRTVSCSRADKGIYFTIQLQPRSIGVYEVSFRQKTPFGFMEYILTTTSQWHTAFERAQYRVRVPKTHRLTFLSLNGSIKEQRGEQVIYTVRKEKYLPAQNLVIHWQRRLH